MSEHELIVTAGPNWDTLLPAAPLAAGDRVEILVGAYRTYAGRILSVVHRYADIQPDLTVWTDSGLTLSGYMPCQLRRIEPVP